MIKKWIDLNLRSLSQVMLQNNPWTGLLFLMGILWSAFVTNGVSLAVAALLGLVVANIVAVLLRGDQQKIEQGLYGYNGVLIGVAALFFFGSGPITFLLIVFGSALSVLLIYKLPQGSPVLTFPFVLVTWLIFVSVMVSAPDLVKSVQDKVELLPVGFQLYRNSFFKSFSQIFLLNHWITGAIFIFALAINSLSSALFAIFGALLALCIVMLSGADAQSVEAGLYGYNAVLTAIALGSVFFKASLKSAFYVFIGVGITIIIQAGLGLLLSIWGIPILTAPFVFAVWVVLGCEKIYRSPRW